MGILTVKFLRLLVTALWIDNTFLGFIFNLFFGTSIFFLPDKYCPVYESFIFFIPSGFPAYTISPPRSPAPGPTSTI